MEKICDYFTRSKFLTMKRLYKDCVTSELSGLEFCAVVKYSFFDSGLIRK